VHCNTVNKTTKAKHKYLIVVTKANFFHIRKCSESKCFHIPYQTILHTLIQTITKGKVRRVCKSPKQFPVKKHSPLTLTLPEKVPSKSEKIYFSCLKQKIIRPKQNLIILMTKGGISFGDIFFIKKYF